MPRQVDHEQRRHQIADALGRVALRGGLDGVSFREVAAEAGMSVALVQHYFGTKQNLLVGSLDIHSARMGARLATALAHLGDDAGPLQRVRVVAAGFLPVDPEGRATMLLYHAFAAAALTDAALRESAGFQQADALVDVLASLLHDARAAGQVRGDVDPEEQARVLRALVLGLSLAVLLDHTTATDARSTLDHHLDGLRRERTD